MENKKKKKQNWKICYGVLRKPDLLEINTVITGRGMAGVDCLNSRKRGWWAGRQNQESCLMQWRRKSRWNDAWKNSVQEWKSHVRQQHRFEGRTAVPSLQINNLYELEKLIQDRFKQKQPASLVLRSQTVLEWHWTEYGLWGHIDKDLLIKTCARERWGPGQGCWVWKKEGWRGLRGHRLIWSILHMGKDTGAVVRV